MSTVSNAERQAKKIRGEVKPSWQSAISNALINWREFLPRSIVVASLASILRMLQGYVLQGFILWVIFASLLFVIHVSEHARLQRKESRNTSINKFQERK